MRLVAILVAILPTITVVPAGAAPPPLHSGERARPPIVHAPRIIDLDRRLDAFEYDLYTTNLGSLAFNVTNGVAGLEFPRGSGKFVMFASGLWVGAQVAGEKRVTVAEYSMEWQPGRILGGVPEPVATPGLETWKVVPAGGLYSPADTAHAASLTGDPLLHHGWGEYAAGGGAVGAPVRLLSLPGPTGSVDVPAPDLPGSRALWSVFNDANPSSHTNNAGSSPPLGLEVRQAVYGNFILPRVAYVRWTLVHRGATPLDSAYVGFWADPDLGTFTDDKVGWSAEHHMGYVYNALNNDAVYGSMPPACGIQFLDGPPGVSAAAFSTIINGTDPSNAIQSYRGLQGLYTLTGEEIVDPTTNQPTRFAFPGNPITSTGWLDAFGADKRMLVSVGPFSLAPGDSAEFTFAFVVEQGLNRFDSIQRLFCTAANAKHGYELDFQPPFPPTPPECEAISGSCPVPAATWAGFCDDPSKLPPNALQYVAGLVSGATRGIVLPPPLEDSFCDSVSVSDAGTPRQRAVREYLTMLANMNAMPGMTSDEGKLIGLSGNEPVSCAWSTATTVAELAERAPDVPDLDVVYIETGDLSEPRDYQPVDFGLEAYGGGAGFASSFFGSSLDPFAQPDSFPDVEIRFDANSTQKAYRYLRLQLADGGGPPGGREYRYAGYRSVPLEAIDLSTGDRLELAFVELATCDAAGSLLDPSQQPATFDSTWGPSAQGDGGREYLFVLRRGDSGSPRPDMEVDGAVADLAPERPFLYVATLVLNEEGNLPEPGEKLVYTAFPVMPARGVDARLIQLGALLQDDPKTIAGYEEIIACLTPINAAIGLGLECESTPVAITLEEGVVEDGVARLAWYVAAEGAGPFDLARRQADDVAAPWSILARLTVDGTRRVRYEDRAIAPGERWTYGLFDPADAQHPLDTITLDVPGAASFALRISTGARGAETLAHFSLPARGEARLVLYDAAGRRRHEESFGVLEAGPHRRALSPARGAPGLYFAKLVFGGRSVVARAVLLD